jgi:hypothetical protein
MTWLLALVFRPFGALLFWGFAAFLAVLIAPVFPPRWRAVLYDPGIQKRNRWKFAFFGMTACYGTLAVVYWFTK